MKPQRGHAQRIVPTNTNPLKLCLAIVLAAATGAACQRANKTDDVTTTVGALTGPQQFTIVLPNTAGLPSVAVGATNDLRVADRASMVSATGFVTMVNTGTVQTDVGTDTKLGNIVSQSAIVIRDRSRITGDVQSAGDVTLVNGATVSGTIKRNTPITPLQTFSWTVTFPTPGSNVNLEPDTSRTIAPGSYGDISVKSRSTLRLSPGTFFVNSFSVEPQATIATDGGPVFLYVATTVNFKGTIAAGNQDANFLLGVVGTGTVFLESPFTGTIVAPNATIRFATVQGTGYRGSFFARGIDIQPDSIITLKTFAGWGKLFPLPEPRPIDVHPQVNCVAAQGGGTFRALFGYVNDSFEKQRVFAGAQNQFTPAPANRGQIQRFLPSRHPAAFATVFNGAAMTWSMPGGTATATSAAPVCPATTCSPACGSGQGCVGGNCVTVCGDGLCAGDEGCGSCPADCGCGTGETCFQNGCANPARCGSEWQCGSGTSAGVQVDCGPCPGAGTCVNHVCT